jgi:hypothetical protein
MKGLHTQVFCFLDWIQRAPGKAVAYGCLARTSTGNCLQISRRSNAGLA